MTQPDNTNFTGGTRAPDLRGPVDWTPRPGTVLAGTVDLGTECVVSIDADPLGSGSGVSCISMVGPLAIGTRVYTVDTRPAGVFVVGFATAQLLIAVRLTQDSQPTTSGAVTTVSWDGPQYDSANFWDAAAPTIVTIPLTGLYAIHFEGRWASALLAGQRFLSILQNGSMTTAHRHLGIATELMEMDVNDELYLEAGDQITFQCFQTSTSAIALEVASATVRYLGKVTPL